MDVAHRDLPHWNMPLKAVQIRFSACIPAMQESVYVIDDADSVCTVVDGVVKTILPPASINFSCGDSKMQNASTWLGIAGLMFMGILMSRSFKGSIITGEPCITPSHLLASR